MMAAARRAPDSANDRTNKVSKSWEQPTPRSLHHRLNRLPSCCTRPARPTTCDSLVGRASRPILQCPPIPIRRNYPRLRAPLRAEPAQMFIALVLVGRDQVSLGDRAALRAAEPQRLINSACHLISSGLACELKDLDCVRRRARLVTGSPIVGRHVPAKSLRAVSSASLRWSLDGTQSSRCGSAGQGKP